VFKAIYYMTPRGDSPVVEFMDSLERKVAKKVIDRIRLLEARGPNLLRPYSAHVRGDIRELRIQFGHKSVRILYFYFEGEMIILAHAFLKKSNELSERDIVLAENRMKGWRNRYEKK